MKGIQALVAGLLVLLLCAAGQAVQQELAAPTKDELQARIQQLEASGTLDKPGVVDAINGYVDAIAKLDRAAELRARVAAYEKSIEEAPGLLEVKQAERAKVPEPVSVSAPKDATVTQVEQSLAEATSARDAAATNDTNLQTESQRRAKRLKELPDELAAARSALSDLEQKVRAAAAKPPTEEPARSAYEKSLCELELARLRVQSLEKESASYEATRELLAVQKDLAARELSRAEERVKAWQKIVNDTRREASERVQAETAQQLRNQVTADVPALKELASGIETLLAVRTGDGGVTEKIASVTAELEKLKTEQSDLDQEIASTKEKIRLVGLIDEMGAALRKQYEKLPKVKRLAREQRLKKRDSSHAQLALLRYQDERELYRNIDDQLRTLLEKIGSKTAGHSHDEVAEVARGLLTTKRDVLASLIDDYETYLTKLLDFETVTDHLIETTQGYADYLEDRILWVRSVEGSPFPSLSNAAEALDWLVLAPNWPRSAELTVLEVVRRPWVVLLLVLLVVSSFASRPFLKRRLGQFAERVARFKSDSYFFTVRAAVVSFFLALPVSLLLWALGYLLTMPPAQKEIGIAVGMGLRSTGLLLLPVEFLRELLRPNGIGQAHFRWPRENVDLVRRALTVFLIGVFPLVFVEKAFENQVRTDWNDSLGRLAFILGSIASTVFLYYVLRRRGLSIGPMFERFRLFWFVPIVFSPLFFAVLATLGYYYAALRFDERYQLTVRFLLILLLVYALFTRWLFIARRRLAYEQAIARREAKEEGPEAAATIEEELAHLPRVDAQTRRIFKSLITIALAVGLYAIWGEAIPVVDMLRRVEIYPHFKHFTPQEFQAFEQPAVFVTLGHVAVAALILAFTAIAVKNIPGLLEITILQRLPLDAGARFAASTLTRYAILIVGGSVAFNAIGIGWSTVQWLAAALTFGLAFGLQEIFANFVAGLIVLIERPIRVGDIVTVANTTGRVTRIQMRATTILDWDRRELLVPNKEFITASLINWTLSDSVSRVILPVGVAYGSDTVLARKLLVEQAKRHSLVLKDPEPLAVFIKFGESSLDLELRYFIGDRDHWFPTVDSLHTQIDEAFKKAGIEIAFPQRDLHIRSARGLDLARERGFQQTAPERS